MCDDDEKGVPGFGLWQSKPATSDWQDFPTTLVADLDWAYTVYERSGKRSDKAEYTFKLSQSNMGLREGDPEELSYTINFSTMKQICVQNPGRERDVRKIKRRDVRLSRSQEVAIHYLEKAAYTDCGAEVRKLKARVEKLTECSEAFDRLWVWMRDAVPILIHLKLGMREDGEYQIDRFMRDPKRQYRNLFEVGEGRGSTDRSVRSAWERRMFGPVYDRMVKVDERPKYGCLNLTDAPSGVEAAIGYGTSYLVLKPSVRWRCTMTSADSAVSNSIVATTRQFAKFMGDNAFGMSDSDLLKVCRHRGEQISKYREVQIHGTVCFDRDVEKLCYDSRLPSAVVDKCREWAARDGFTTEAMTAHASARENI